MVHDNPTPTVDAAHKQQPSVPDDESTATARVAIAQVAPATPAPRRGGEVVEEVRLYRWQLLAGLCTPAIVSIDNVRVWSPQVASAPAASEVCCAP